MFRVKLAKQGQGRLNGSKSRIGHPSVEVAGEEVQAPYDVLLSFELQKHTTPSACAVASYSKLSVEFKLESLLSIRTYQSFNRKPLPQIQ